MFAAPAARGRALRVQTAMCTPACERGSCCVGPAAVAATPRFRPPAAGRRRGQPVGVSVCLTRARPPLPPPPPRRPSAASFKLAPSAFSKYGRILTRCTACQPLRLSVRVPPPALLAGLVVPARRPRKPQPANPPHPPAPFPHPPVNETPRRCDRGAGTIRPWPGTKKWSRSTRRTVSRAARWRAARTRSALARARTHMSTTHRHTDTHTHPHTRTHTRTHTARAHTYPRTHSHTRAPTRARAHARTHDSRAHAHTRAHRARAQRVPPESVAHTRARTRYPRRHAQSHAHARTTALLRRASGSQSSEDLVVSPRGEGPQHRALERPQTTTSGALAPPSAHPAFSHVQARPRRHDSCMRACASPACPSSPCC